MVLDTMAILRRAGFRVVVSRTGPTTVLRLRAGDVSGRILTDCGAHDDVAARDVCANKAHANVLVGVYFNAGSPANAAASPLTALSVRSLPTTGGWLTWSSRTCSPR
jgi:hypothetical protein